MERHVRRDKLGRKIGYNWWREYVMSVYGPARALWVDRFDETNYSYRPGIIAEARRRERRGGRREITDWLEDNPAPTLKAYLVGLAGTVGPNTLEPEGVDET